MNRRRARTLGWLVGKGVLIAASLAFGTACTQVPPPQGTASSLTPTGAVAHSRLLTAVPTEGRTRALVVFVAFRDDDRPGDPCLDARGWPDPDRLPDYASSLLARSAEPPFADSTLTAYFFRQSNGRFVLFGDVYPQVVRTRHSGSYYTRVRGRGFGHLVEEVLERIDHEVDFKRYDTNPADGVLDQVFLVVRTAPAATFTGVADLSGADQVFGRPGKAPSPDGVRVDWKRSGTILIHYRPGNIVPQLYFVRLMAHEYGHHLWNSRSYFENGHIKPIRSPGTETTSIGYVLMAGRGGARDAGGRMTISAMERDLLGWLDPVEPSVDSAVVSIELADVYQSGRAVGVPLADGDPESPDPVLYLEVLARTGPFSQKRTWSHPGCKTYDVSPLRTEGLLATLSRQAGARVRASVIPADRDLALGHTNAAYAGDLFGSAGHTQLTPWSHGDLKRPDGRPVWIAIDSIAWVADNRMRFDIVPDIRRRPVLRVDSHLGPELNGYTFEAPVRIESGVAVRVQNTRFMVGRSLLMRSGSTLLIGSDAQITMASGATLVMENADLDVRGQLTLASVDAISATLGRVLLRAGAIVRSPLGSYSPPSDEAFTPAELRSLMERRR